MSRRTAILSVDELTGQVWLFHQHYRLSPPPPRLSARYREHRLIAHGTHIGTKRLLLCCRAQVWLASLGHSPVTVNGELVDNAKPVELTDLDEIEVSTRLHHRMILPKSHSLRPIFICHVSLDL